MKVQAIPSIPEANLLQQTASAPQPQRPPEPAIADNVFSPAQIFSRLAKALTSEAPARPEKVALGRELAHATGYPSDNVVRQVASALLNTGEPSVTK